MCIRDRLSAPSYPPVAVTRVQRTRPVSHCARPLSYVGRVTFVHGDLYVRSFDTSVGVVDIMAEIALSGPRIELRDVAVYPRTAARLAVSPQELLWWIRVAAAELLAAGITEIRVTGTRLSGARRGRRVDLVIRLRREQP